MNDNALDRLIELMETLRSPEQGCPWDKKQTYQSLTPHTLEETHEVLSAIEQGDLQALKDELGDLLFQIVFYAQIAKEENQFDLVDVINHLITKMQHRHPHVFGDKQFNDEHELKTYWEKAKQQERTAADSVDAFSSVLDNVPKSMPALSRSQKLQNRAAKTGFDWNNVERVKEKVHEELAELDQALTNKDEENIQHEIGDLLTACVNLSRHLNVDAEQALRLANQRFENRFNYIENIFHDKNRNMQDSSLEELEALWQQAKDHLKDY